MNNLLPKARTAEIIEQEADKELLIYDLRTNKMFQLNATSKIVYRACGKISFEELKRDSKFTDDLIRLALDQLSTNSLVEDYGNNHFGGLSRREIVRRVGLASMIALPVITGLVAPSALSAASAGTANGFACQAAGECRSGRCVATQRYNGSTNSVPDGNRCCAPNGGNRTGTYFAGGGCGIASLCCTGSGTETFIPNAGYSCTCT